MLKDYNPTLKTARIPQRKRLEKLGTVAIGVVESTPVVWNGRLYRFEWVRSHGWGKIDGVTRDVGCYHFVDMETEKDTPDFALDHSFGCCYTENSKMYVHGVRGDGGGQVLDTFVSEDLVNWEMTECLTFPDDVNLYNTSVCKGPDGYVMAIEVGGSNPMVGVPFTCVFAKSDDLINWTLLPSSLTTSRTQSTATTATLTCAITMEQQSSCTAGVTSTERNSSPLRNMTEVRKSSSSRSLSENIIRYFKGRGSICRDEVSA